MMENHLHAHVPIILFIFLSLSLPQTIKSQVVQECPGAKDPSYHDKIDLLLAELLSKSNHTSYFNYTVGVAPDVLYGLYMCRGDISMQRCHACLQDAVPSIKKICPDNVEATVWYADCTLRYANRTIFSNADSNVWGGKGQPSGQGTANQYAKDFGGQFSNLMRPLMEEAARSSPKHFAINKSDISTFATLYGLVQCLPDTRYGDCKQCLVKGYKYFAECCNDRFWGQMFLRGCNLMFSIDPIFDESALLPTSSTSQGDPTLTGDGRQEDLPKNGKYTYIRI